jgi:hypothetical protein
MVIALLLLASWAMPGARAMGVALHVALDAHHGWDGGHSHQQGEGSAPVRTELQRAAHRHELSAPETGPPGVRPDARAWADAGASVLVPITEECLSPPRPAPARIAPGANRRRGSPPPLFLAHGSLLR